MKDNITISLKTSSATFTVELPWDSDGTCLIESFCAMMSGVTYPRSVIVSALEEVLETYKET